MTQAKKRLRIAYFVLGIVVGGLIFSVMLVSNPFLFNNNSIYNDEVIGTYSNDSGFIFLKTKGMNDEIICNTFFHELRHSIQQTKELDVNDKEFDARVYEFENNYRCDYLGVN